MSQELHATSHALEAMAARGIRLPEAVECVAHPQQTWTTSGKTHQRGDIAVTTNRSGTLITTVLYKRDGQWHDDDKRPGVTPMTGGEISQLRSLAQRAKNDPRDRVLIAVLD